MNLARALLADAAAEREATERPHASRMSLGHAFFVGAAACSPGHGPDLCFEDHGCTAAADLCGSGAALRCNQLEREIDALQSALITAERRLYSTERALEDKESEARGLHAELERMAACTLEAEQAAAGAFERLESLESSLRETERLLDWFQVPLQPKSPAVRASRLNRVTLRSLPVMQTAHRRRAHGRQGGSATVAPTAAQSTSSPATTHAHVDRLRAIALGGDGGSKGGRVLDSSFGILGDNIALRREASARPRPAPCPPPSLVHWAGKPSWCGAREMDEGHQRTAGCRWRRARR